MTEVGWWIGYPHWAWYVFQSLFGGRDANCGWWLTSAGWVSGVVYTVIRCRFREECWEVVA